VNNEQGIVKSCETLLDDECRTLNEVNSALSLWVAACGRCMLHRELVKLGVRALYWDTDSVIYLHDPSPLAKNPKLGYHGPHVSEKNLGRFNVLGSLTDEMEGLCSLDFCAPRPKTYGYRYPSLDECKELNQSESFVGIHGRIDLERKKTLEKIAKGSKLMAKGFVQSSVTADDFNFDTLCQLVETGDVVKNGECQSYIAVPTTVWQRCPGGKGALADTQGVLTYNKPKIMMNLSNVKCCQQDYHNPFMPCLPYYHEDLKGDEMEEAKTLLEADGRVHRAQLARKKEEQQRESTKRKREAVDENRKRPKENEKFFTYILKGTGRTYVGWTTCDDRRLDQHLGYLQGGAEATKNRIWEKMCVAEVPDKAIAQRLERTVKRFENRQARFNCMQRQCKDNGWVFKNY